MCGIAGLISNQDKNIQEEKIKKMLAEIKHRGPDDAGFLVADNLAMGMARLSIIDLSGGHQPIYSADKNLAIIFNGEIYNYQELRAELEKAGEKFNTNSDTEVILKLYEKEGKNFLTKLRGMFAFAIFNQVERKVFLARDFFGIKPLYFWAEENKIKAFGSEIKSILTIADQKFKLNEEAMANFLTFQYNPLPESFFKNIFKLAPGHWLEIDLISEEFKIKEYFKFKFNPQTNLEEKKASEKLMAEIQESVRYHMVADVPVGSFLSGGVDSAVIASLGNKNKKDKDFYTFTVGGQERNEFAEAKEVADILKSKHQEIILKKEEYFKALPKIMWHFDEPVADPSAIALYFLARGASEKVKVVMSGEGADEFFGGYNIYREPFALAKIKKIPAIIRWPILKIAHHLPFSFWGLNYLKRAALPLSKRYLGNAQIFKWKEGEKILQKKYPHFSLANLYAEAKNLSEPTQMQYIDINTWLVGDILAKADKMTMANSLELRVPFLDYQIADFAKNIPDSLKFKNGQTKYLFRQSLKNLLPANTKKRKKLGFPVPLAEWLAEDDFWQRKILESEIIKKYFKEKEIKKVFNLSTAKENKKWRKIFVLLTLVLWSEQYQDNLEL